MNDIVLCIGLTPMVLSTIFVFAVRFAVHLRRRR